MMRCSRFAIGYRSALGRCFSIVVLSWLAFPSPMEAGLINGEIVLAPATTNLTVEGSDDWHYWQGTSTTPFDEKLAPALSIGSLSTIGSPPLFDYGGGVGTTYTWTDGTAAPSSGADGLLQAFPAANGDGFRLVLPADTHTRRARFYIGGAGGSGTTGQITATLSDGSASPAVDSVAISGITSRVYDVSYRADSAGQTLTLDWIRTAAAVTGSPNVLVSAASLSSPLLDNAGFELPGASGSFPQATSWSGTAPTALHSSFPYGNREGLGASFAFTTPSGTEISQTSSEIFLPGLTYTFTGYGVDNNINNENDLELRIGYDDGGFVELASAIFDLTGLSDWTLLDGVTYQTGLVGAELGKNVEVRIRAIQVDFANGGVFFDEMSLTVVPEPAALMLAGFGLFALACFIRRKGM